MLIKKERKMLIVTNDLLIGEGFHAHLQANCKGNKNKSYPARIMRVLSGMLLFDISQAYVFM